LPVPDGLEAPSITPETGKAAPLALIFSYLMIEAPFSMGDR
jgi:hypothetical protein